MITPEDYILCLPSSLLCRQSMIAKDRENIDYTGRLVARVMLARGIHKPGDRFICKKL